MKFRHTIARVKVEDMIHELQNFGEEGWELVQVVPHSSEIFLLFFKKPAEPKS